MTSEGERCEVCDRPWNDCDRFRVNSIGCAVDLRDFEAWFRDCEAHRVDWRARAHAAEAALAEVPEQIAAWLEAEAAAWASTPDTHNGARETLCSELAKDVRAGRWRKP
jgi:hypothetical protein